MVAETPLIVGSPSFPAACHCSDLRRQKVIKRTFYACKLKAGTHALGQKTDKQGAKPIASIMKNKRG